MRLDYALVFSFLFVPAVLADVLARTISCPSPVGSIIQQPRPDSDWAGAVWCTDDKEKTVDKAIGRFSVPLVRYGDKGAGFNIRVGIGGYKSGIRGFQASAGVKVEMDLEWGFATYEAFAECHGYPLVKPITTKESGLEFPIYPGDVIDASLHIVGSSTYVYIVLTKIASPASSGFDQHLVQWRTPVTCTPIMTDGLYHDAEWIVEKFAGHLEIPPFGEVIFSEIMAQVNTMGEKTLHTPQQDIFSINGRTEATEVIIGDELGAVRIGYFHFFY